MEGEIFVLTIILGSFVFAGVMQWMKQKADAQKAATRRPGKEAEAEIAALQERVSVLERIVTDKSDRLAKEIDAL